MEISAINSTSGYLLPAFAEPRVPREAAQKVSVARESVVSINNDRKDLPEQRTAAPRQKDSVRVDQAQAAEDVRVESEASRADRAAIAASERDAALATSGGVKMDVEDGHRVLKVFDSKDILIYQLPPKGALMLISAQEQSQQSQVRTSA